MALNSFGVELDDGLEGFRGDEAQHRPGARGHLLEGRRILIVGAGTRPSEDADPPAGNGRAISVRCAAEGASVACLDISRPAAAETLSMVEAAGGVGIAVEADVTDAAACLEARLRRWRDSVASTVSC